MTFEEFQQLTTEQKLEVSMAHLAGVLHGQTRLTDNEKAELRQVPSENEFAQNTVTVEVCDGRETISYGRGFAFVGDGVRDAMFISRNAMSGRFLTIRERGARSAARKPKPVKKA